MLQSNECLALEEYKYDVDWQDYAKDDSKKKENFSFSTDRSIENFFFFYSLPVEIFHEFVFDKLKRKEKKRNDRWPIETVVITVLIVTVIRNSRIICRRHAVLKIKKKIFTMKDQS